MPDLATLQKRYEAILAAISSGASEVRYANETIRYRSLSDMYAVRDDLAAQLGLNLGAGRPVRRTVTSYSGGF